MSLKMSMAAFALLGSMALPTQAVQVFSNYQGGNTGGSAFGTGQALAVRFTPAANAYLTDVQLYVFSGGNGFSSALDVFLLSEAGGKPAAVLETLGTLPAQTSSVPNLVQIQSSANTLLQAGTPYWLAATPHAGGQVAAGWAGGGTVVSTAFANSGGVSGPWGVVSPNTFQFVINGSVSAPVCLLDIDGNGAIDALTDGLMILRTLFGLTGTAVTTGAIGNNATRTTWADIQPVIFPSKLDIDGNGATAALTDGLMILRAMFGLTGASVTNGAVAPGAPRSTWADVRGYMNANCGTNFAP